MKRSTKAALLSALVYPGIGHYFLKKYIAALVLIAATSVLLYKAIVGTVTRTLEIMEKIQSGAVSPDIATITDLVSRQAEDVGSYAWSAFFLLWLIAIIDSYRVGRRQDKPQQTTHLHPPHH